MECFLSRARHGRSRRLCRRLPSQSRMRDDICPVAMRMCRGSKRRACEVVSAPVVSVGHQQRGERVHHDRLLLRGPHITVAVI
eukprot:5861353-Pyramimonas_sp.AAC.2